MPEISIIVPIYKTESYLERCINSILNQSFTDFELILVDDGSPDSCPQICDAWAKKDKRICVIHKENGGLSSARNAGIYITRGNYIGFVDSDDWIAPDMYEMLYNSATKHNADYAAIEMSITKSSHENYIQPEYKERVLNQSSLFELFFRVSDQKIHYCVCDKLFRTQVIRNIRFWEGMRFEDIDFNFRVIQNCKSGVYINQIKYFWFYNNDSITRNKLVFSDLQLIEIWKNIVIQCQREFPQYERYAQMNYERAFMGILGKAAKFGVSEQYENWNEDQRYLLKNLRMYFNDLLKWDMPISRKVLLIGLYINPSLVSIPFRLKGGK